MMKIATGIYISLILLLAFILFSIIVINKIKNSPVFMNESKRKSKKQKGENRNLWHTIKWF